MEHLEKYVFDELNINGITPTNSEWRMLDILSKSLEKWMVEEYSATIQEWLVKVYEPAKSKFNTYMLQNFPNTFIRFIDNEVKVEDINETGEDAVYEEIKD